MKSDYKFESYQDTNIHSYKYVYLYESKYFFNINVI